jgi:hypothetical protein
MKKTIITSVSIGCIAVAAFGFGPTITPDNMSKHDLDVKVTFRPCTIKEGNQPERPTGMVIVQVSFDPKSKGIEEYASAYLSIADTVHTPVVPALHPKNKTVSWVQFTIHESLITKTTVVLEKPLEGIRAVDCKIDIGAFQEKGTPNQ